MWCLDVGIPFDEEGRYDPFVVANAIESSLGMAEHAGSGFGFRDLQFAFKTYQDGQQAQATALHTMIAHGVHHHDLNEFTGSDRKSYAQLFSFPQLP